jgi:ankyrin repeat protein
MRIFHFHVVFKNGETALHGAAMFGHLDVVRILLKAGANPNSLNREGDNPYQLALKCKQHWVSDYLKSVCTPRAC